MSRKENIDINFDFAAHHAIIARISEIDTELYEQRKQRPYNIPYIRTLLRERAHLQINHINIKNVLDKVDGCF